MGLLEDGRSGMDPGQQVGSQSRAWFLVTIRREKTAERAPSAVPKLTLTLGMAGSSTNANAPITTLPTPRDRVA